MLPFLKKQEGSASGPIDPIERKPDEDKEYNGLETAMEELHSALNSQNYADAAEIFKSCLELCREGSHE